MAPEVQAHVLMSSDGKWWWDGAAWRQTEAAQSSSTGTLTWLVMPHRVAMSLLRVSLYGLMAALIVYAFLSLALGQMTAQNARLVAQTSFERHQIADLRAQITGMQATIDDLRSRWIGDPALWQPSGVPSNTNIAYFDLSGTTQAGLIQAFRDADLCGKYKCLVDPAVPEGFALALEIDSRIEPNSAYCYSPRTLSYSWEPHTILLPRWNPKLGTVKIDLVQRWNALEPVLLTHEAGHVSVADAWLSAQNAKAQQLPNCSSALAFWSDPHLFDSLDAAQNDYHAKLRADCRPEIGCIPAGWMGW